MSKATDKLEDLILEMQTTKVFMPTGSKFSLMYLLKNIGVKNRVKYLRDKPGGKDVVDWGWLLNDGNEIWHMARSHVNFSDAPLIEKKIR